MLENCERRLNRDILLPNVVNMVAHSRGGVVAIMAAHLLYSIHRKAKVRIFAIDPVPGTGGLTSEMVKLPPNVTNYVGVYALDETSGGFNALIPRPLFNGSYIDPLVAGNGTSDGSDGLRTTPAFSAVGELVNCLATAWLIAWGSNAIKKATVDIETLKRTISANQSEFRKMRNFTYMPLNIHSHQHWNERGVTSSEGRNPLNWHYLEDAIGTSPLVQRISRIPNMFRCARPNPGRVRWESLEKLNDDIISGGKWRGE
jgi:hypothetical protein